ncbi:MAG: hypothetical protein F4Z65_03915 [Acidobacteria bacterium]|nr:hypothetical protein [Acidobacteriota bacterium]MYA46411.1 hypothetical protein [Acidobacteriota bacterium]MYI40123.1 hypothetical protein [Acidobacteriota bacterium]
METFGISPHQVKIEFRAEPGESAIRFAIKFAQRSRFDDKTTESQASVHLTEDALRELGDQIHWALEDAKLWKGRRDSATAEVANLGD